MKQKPVKMRFTFTSYPGLEHRVLCLKLFSEFGRASCPATKIFFKRHDTVSLTELSGFFFGHRCKVQICGGSKQDCCTTRYEMEMACNVCHSKVKER